MWGATTPLLCVKGEMGPQRGQQCPAAPCSGDQTTRWLLWVWGLPPTPRLPLPQPGSRGAAQQGFPWMVLGQGCSTPWKDIFRLEKQVMR